MLPPVPVCVCVFTSPPLLSVSITQPAQPPVALGLHHGRCLLLSPALSGMSRSKHGCGGASAAWAELGQTNSGGVLQVGRCFGGEEGGERKQESFRCNFTFCSLPRVRRSHRPCGHRRGVSVCAKNLLPAKDKTLPPFNFAAVQSVDDATEYRERLFDSSSWNSSKITSLQCDRHQQNHYKKYFNCFLRNLQSAQLGFQFTQSGIWSE